MAKENVIINKTFDFSLTTIKIYKHLTEQKRIRFIQTTITFRNQYWSKRRGSDWSNFKKRVHRKNGNLS